MSTSRCFMHTVREWFVFGLVAVATVLLLEAGLALVSRVTHSPRLAVLYPRIPYPRQPERFLKIAVFGESSAAGWIANRSFADILEHELRGRLSDSLYVRNFAEPAATFSRDQAELAKAALAYFDVILIYAGNNEIWIPSAARGTLAVYNERVDPLDDAATHERASRLKGQLSGHSSIRDLLEGRSRLFAIGRRLQHRVTAAMSRRRRSVEHEMATPKPPLLSDKKVLSDADIESVGPTYEKDLREIKTAAADQGKLLIVGTVATHLAWPPMFSRNGEALSYYTTGMEALEKKDFARAWQHLIKAKDEDGWPLRVLSDINERIRTVMGGSGNVADVEADVLRAVEKGDSFDALFADFQHPNLRGQILVARSFISKLPDFRSRRAVAAKFDSLLEPESPAVDSYRQELGIAASTVVADAGKNLEWLLELRRYAVDEAIFFDVAVRAWSRMEAAGSARYEAGRAVLLAFTQHPPLAEITRLLASARTRSRSQANVVLDNGLPGLPAEEIRGKFRSLQLEGSR